MYISMRISFFNALHCSIDGGNSVVGTVPAVLPYTEIT